MGQLTEPEAQERVHVGTVLFEVTSLHKATNDLVGLSKTRRGIPIRLANAYCVAVAAGDSSYADLLSGPGLNFPDGSPVVWYMRRRHNTQGLPGRVRGPSLFTSVIDHGRNEDLRHFFLGTTDETLRRLVHNVRRRYPGVIIAGTHAPKFGPLNSNFFDEATKAVSESDSEIVWVALGSPKQDYAAAELASRVSMPCVGVGAAFDFVAGTAKEAPHWIQNSGLEWLYRLTTEPRRLWKRYIFGNLRFIAAIVKHNNYTGQ